MLVLNAGIAPACSGASLSKRCGSMSGSRKIKDVCHCLCVEQKKGDNQGFYPYLNYIIYGVEIQLVISQKYICSISAYA